MKSFAQAFFDFAQSVKPESRLRFAPTPSGFLHLGNALNFTLNWLASRAIGSDSDSLTPSETINITPSPQIFLRIDDLDTDRKRPEYEADIFETLQWLKLDWDRAPNPQFHQSPIHQSPIHQSPIHQSPIHQSNPAFRQAGNLQNYHQVLARLRERDLLFACQKSRRDLEPFGNSYPPEFRNQNLSLDDPDVAWRIKTPPRFPLPDFVVRRRDGIPAYQVASFSDDSYLGVTHVVRGADLEDSTTAQRFLAEMLSEDSFLKIKFLHHPLVLGEAGEKLSKSAGSSALKAMREAGTGPEKVFRTVGNWLGLEGDSAKELLAVLRKCLA